MRHSVVPRIGKFLGKKFYLAKKYLRAWQSHA